MILGDLLGRPVLDADGRRLGYLSDVRLALDPETPDQPTPTARVHSLVVVPQRHGSFLGYERRQLRAPLLVARFLRWRERGSFLVLWADVAATPPDAIRLRSGHRRWSVALDPGSTYHRRAASGQDAPREQ